MSSKAGSTRHNWPASLWAILGLSLLLNVWGIWFGLPDTWHPDELVGRSVAMARNFTLNPHSFLYGSMHYYLQLLTMLPTYLLAELASTSFETQKTLAYLAARMLSAVMGTACVAFTYVLARMLFNQTVALFSALLLALSTGLVSISHFATVDVPMLFWMMASYAMSARALNSGGLRNYLFAGVFAGFAAGTKYAGGVAILALVVACLLDRNDHRFKHLSLGMIGAAVAFIAVNVPIFFASCEFFEGFIRANAYNMTVHSDSQENSAILVLRNIAEAAGMAVSPLISLAFAYLVTISINKKETREVAFLLSATIPYFILISNIHYASTRHALPMLPALLISLGKMLADLTDRTSLQGWVRRFGYGLLTVSVLLSGLYALGTMLQFTFDGRNLATTWIMKHARAGSRIEVTQFGPRIPGGRFVVEERPALYKLRGDSVDPKRALVFRVLYPAYLRYKFLAESAGLCERRGYHYVGWYEVAEARADNALATFDPSIEGLERRGPDLLVVSSFYYDRFIADPTISPEGRFFSRLFGGETSYRQVAELRYEYLPWLEPFAERINPKVRIFQRSRDGSDAPAG